MTLTMPHSDPVVRLSQEDDPNSKVVHFLADEPLRLEGGGTLAPFSIAYQT